jgi:hypothetical protein
MDCPLRIETVANVAYIKQLRMINADDYVPFNSNPNAVRFFLEDHWVYNEPQLTSKDPHFEATFKVVFRWFDQLMLELVEIRKNKNVHNTDHIQDNLQYLSARPSSYSNTIVTFIRHQFDWTGCRSTESRMRKFLKHKQIFQEKLESKLEKEQQLYNTVIKKTISSIDQINAKAENTLMNSFKNNLSAYTEEDVKEHKEFQVLTEEELILKKQILEIEEKMKPFRDKLRDIEDKKHTIRYDLIKEQVTNHDLPYEIKKGLIKDIEAEKEKGIPRIHRLGGLEL